MIALVSGFIFASLTFLILGDHIGLAQQELIVRRQARKGAYSGSSTQQAVSAILLIYQQFCLLHI
jgi:hypothetical protein